MGAAYARLLLGLYSSTFLIRASFALVLVVISAAFADLTPLRFSLAIALIPFAELICVPIAGVVNDRYGRRNIFMAGLAVATVSLLLRVVWRDVYGLAAMNIVHGASAAMLLVTSLALLADHTPAKSRGREMGVFDFVTIFGYLVGFIAAFLLVEFLPERTHYAFGAAAAAALGALVFAYFYVTEPRRHVAVGEVRIMDIVRVAKHPRVALVIGPWFIVFMFIGALSGFLERARGVLGFTGGETAIGLVVVGVVLLVAQVGFGLLSDRYGRASMMLLGAAGFFALMTLLAVILVRASNIPAQPAHIEDASAVSEALVAAFRSQGIALGIAFLATLAFGPAALAALADEAERGPTGLTMSLYSLVLSAGFILGPVLTATALTIGGTAGLALWFEVMAVAFAAMIWTRYRHDLPRPGRKSAA